MTTEEKLKALVTNIVPPKQKKPKPMSKKEMDEVMDNLEKFCKESCKGILT